MLRNLGRGAVGEDLKGWEGGARAEETQSWQPQRCQVKKCHVQQEGTRRWQGHRGHSPECLGWVAVTEIVAEAQWVDDLDREDGMPSDHFACPPRRAGSSVSLAKEQLDLPST